jgi:hypothetical protein
MTGEGVGGEEERRRERSGREEKWRMTEREN